MPIAPNGLLNACSSESNCATSEWDFPNVNKKFGELISILESLPRTKLLEQTQNYWHGVCYSLIFRFPDDLEILKVPQKGIIQIRSASRVGMSDLGVNKRRINNLYKKLIAISK